MLDSITIKNYKAVQSEEGLTLSGLTNVNYLVGKNGCGKSSVLEGIELLNYFNPQNIDISNSTFYTYFTAYPTLENYKKYLKLNENPIIQINNVELLEINKSYFKCNICLEVGIYDNYFFLTNDIENSLNKIINPDGLITKEYFEKFAPKSFTYQISRINIASKSIIELVEVRNFHEPDLLELYESFLAKFLPNYKYDVPADNKILFNGEIRTFDQISNGQYAIINFANIMIGIMRRHKQGFIVIEEPENCLHPEFQKNLPSYFEHFQRGNIKFLITTHSPFIISEAAKYPETQKVYLLEDGQTRDLKGNLGLGQEGYSGNQCKYVVNEMLGVDTSDFLPSKIVFCEQSLCAFLQIVNARFYNKDLQFKTPMDKAGNDQGGDHFVIEIAELEKIIEKGAKNLLPTDFTIIMDIPNESHLLRKLENVRAKYPDKILTLTTMSFEEKFDQDPKLVSRQLGGKIQNAKDKAIVITKEGFETKFAEILKIFNT